MNDALYSALCACFGLAPTSDEAVLLIRPSFQEPDPLPQPPRSTNVIYYTLEPDSAAKEPPMYVSPTARTPSVESFSAWNLHIVCYGPEATENARKIRAFLYLDGAGMPRSILRKAGIYPIPNPPEPAETHEPEGSFWRRRADLTVRLRISETQTHPAQRNTIRSAPDILLKTSR